MGLSLNEDNKNRFLSWFSNVLLTGRCFDFTDVKLCVSYVSFLKGQLQATTPVELMIDRSWTFDCCKYLQISITSHHSTCFRFREFRGFWVRWNPLRWEGCCRYDGAQKCKRKIIEDWKSSGSVRSEMFCSYKKPRVYYVSVCLSVVSTPSVRWRRHLSVIKRAEIRKVSGNIK